MTTLLWVLGGSLGISFICSVLEAVLLSLNYSYVAVLREEGKLAGEYLHRMQSRIDEPISAILTLNTIAHTTGAAVGGGLALRQFGDEGVAVFSAGFTLAVLLLSEIIPKTMGATYWRTFAVPAAYVLQGLVWIMKPVLIPLSLFSGLVAKRGSPPRIVSRAELEVLAKIGRREGTLRAEETRIVTNLMNLDKVVVGEVMTPRTDIIAVPIDATIEEAKNLMLDEGHLRLPVYEGDLDSIVGILLARDLWQADRNGVNRIQELVRPVPYAATNKPVEQLILDLREKRGKMLIVVDEFGGTAGLATLEDMIEEIIGEIQDEHEDDEPLPFQDVGGGGTRIWGAVSIREVNEHLSLDLPEDSFDTVGGYVFGLLNRIPMAGDEVQIPAGLISVAKMRGRRVEYLRFCPNPR